jgi:hypothetical protein
MAFGLTGFGVYLQAHILGATFSRVDPTLRAAAFAQAQREMENAMGEAIPSADSALGDNVRADLACYELTMHLLLCAATPGSGGAVPVYLSESAGDASKIEARPDPNVWPGAVWRWLGGPPGVRLSRG